MMGYLPSPRQELWRVVAVARLSRLYRRVSHVCCPCRPDGVTGSAWETRQERRTV
jgi:hypothetical protein